MADQAISPQERLVHTAAALFRGLSGAVVTYDQIPPCVGIDLSLRATGIAHDTGQTRLVGREDVTKMAWASRISLLHDLAAEIADYAVEHGAEVAVIEGLDMARSYGGQIERSYLWCEVVRLLIAARVSVHVAPSSQLKMYATGNGGSKITKREVMAAVTQLWPLFQIRHNNRLNDNLADASVACALARAVAGYPLTPDLPLDQTRALERVQSVFSARS